MLISGDSECIAALLDALIEMIFSPHHFIPCISPFLVDALSLLKRNLLLFVLISFIYFCTFIYLFECFPPCRSISGGCVWSSGRDGAELAVCQLTADWTGVTTGSLPQPPAEVFPPERQPRLPAFRQVTRAGL